MDTLLAVGPWVWVALVVSSSVWLDWGEIKNGSWRERAGKVLKSVAITSVGLGFFYVTNIWLPTSNQNGEDRMVSYCIETDL